MGLVEDDPLIVGISQGIISSGRMTELMSRHRVPPHYFYKILEDDGYVFMLGPLEVVLCEESYWAKFHLPLYPFIKRLFVRYGLVPV